MFNHKCAVLLFLAKEFSKTIRISKSETDLSCMIDRSISSAHMRSALVFCETFLPERIFSTPANAGFIKSDSPVFANKVPIHPTKDIKVRMPPRIWEEIFPLVPCDLGCYYKVLCKKHCVTSSGIYIDQRHKTNMSSCMKSNTSFLASLVLKPVYSGISKPFPSNFIK